MPTTAGRSRGRQGVHSGAQGAAGDHLRNITATLAVTAVIIGFVLVATKAGRDIDAATQRFMLYYAGVFALIGLTGSVLVGLVATDRIIMRPGHRVMAQAVHRAVSFGALAFLVIHIVTEILAQRSHVIDAFIPFLSPYRTFYIGLGTIASDLVVLIVVTSILRKRFTAHGRAWRWRAIHYSSYVAFVVGVLHGLLGGRTADPYVDWSYGFAIAVTALGLAVRFLAISLRSKEHVGPAAGADRARGPASSPLRAAAMSVTQAHLGGTVTVLPGGPAARGTDSWAMLPAQGWSPSSGPLPALGAAPAAGPARALGPPSAFGPAPALDHAPTLGFAPAYAVPSPAGSDPGFTPLGAPPYGDGAPGGMRGRPYLASDQPGPTWAGPGSARQPLYEPGYDGPPRYAGAPRGHGAVPQDELSSYPYGPRGDRAPSGPHYPDGYASRPGSGAPRASRAASPNPRAAISPPPRPADRGTGPTPRLEPGSAPRSGTGPMPRALGPGQPPRPGPGSMPAVSTGPMPWSGTGPMPRSGTGPMPRAGTGPMPRAGTGPMPRAGSSPRAQEGPRPQIGTRTETGPRADSGPMPRLGTGPLPRYDTGPLSRPDTGPLPRSNTGPMARSGTGPLSRAGNGPWPPASGGSGPRAGAGGTPKHRAGQPPRSDTGPMPGLGTGPMPRPDAGSQPRTITGSGPRLDHPMPPADTVAGPLSTARPSRTAKTNDPKYREMPGPTGGAE